MIDIFIENSNIEVSGSQLCPTYQNYQQQWRKTPMADYTFKGSGYSESDMISAHCNLYKTVSNNSNGWLNSRTTGLEPGNIFCISMI